VICLTNVISPAARPGQELARKGLKQYHIVWLWLFMAWMMLYIDRSITGPVVAWMIENHVSFLASAPLPHALGGIIGSMFFAGYMLTQFPAGYLGDKYGNKALIVISLAWSGIATFVSGLARDLQSFVALRILTGLGEGAYYSNDRAVVQAVTPLEKRGLGMGVVFVGLAAGLTVATLFAPWLLDFASLSIGKEAAWSVPFLIFSLPTLLICLAVWHFVGEKVERRVLAKAGIRLLLVSALFLIVLMATYTLTVDLGLGSVFQACAVLLAATGLLVIIYSRLRMVCGKVLHDRRLIIMYVSAIPILYTLWFFGFWALLVVSEATKLGLSGAAAYAALFGVASGIGYPVGGKIYDAAKRNRIAPRWVYVALCLAVAFLVFIVAFLANTAAENVLLFGLLIFLIGVLFAAAQTAHMTFTSELAPAGMAGQTFGMWNLVAEVGAVISPVLSGALRDLTGDWTVAIILDGLLLLISAMMVLFVRIQGDLAGNRSHFVRSRH
jgi:MFS transporter, ACS family, D-galactonate transporter